MRLWRHNPTLSSVGSPVNRVAEGNKYGAARVVSGNTAQDAGLALRLSEFLASSRTVCQPKSVTIFVTMTCVHVTSNSLMDS